MKKHKQLRSQLREEIKPSFHAQLRKETWSELFLSGVCALFFGVYLEVRIEEK